MQLWDGWDPKDFMGVRGPPGRWVRHNPAVVPPSLSLLPFPPQIEVCSEPSPWLSPGLAMLGYSTGAVQ